jgi:RNA polymerase sigma-70 factor, ECF subfamily
MTGPVAGTSGRGRDDESVPGRASTWNRTAVDSASPSLDAPDDLALIQAIGEGSEPAFRLLFSRWAPPLRRFLVRATGSREAGEDLLQEAFLRVLGAASRYVPDAPPGAWLYRICANLSYSFWRKEARAPRAMSTLGDRLRADPNVGVGASRAGGVAGEWFASGWGGPGMEPGPEAARLRGVFARDLESALAELPVNQRMAFLLKAGQGLTYEAAAEVLGCPVGTVKSRFHHAVLGLRVALREWEDGIGTEARHVVRREASHDDM